MYKRNPIQFRSQVITGSGPIDWVKTGVSRAKEFITGRKLGAPAVEELKRKMGNQTIYQITVCRTPVHGAIKMLLNLLSAGRFEQAMRAASFHDRLWHLFLIIDTREGGRVAMEKNEVLSVEGVAGSRGGECMLVPNIGRGMTVEQFINNGLHYMGATHMYTYRAFSWNCQDWVSNMLRANRLMTPVLDKFINQDVATLAKRTPSITQRVANMITDFAARAQVLRGRGKQKTLSISCSTMPNRNKRTTKRGKGGCACKRGAGHGPVIVKQGFRWLPFQKGSGRILLGLHRSPMNASS